jgi:predicted nucleotidyltransferase
VIDYELLRSEIAQHPYPLVFATISGAHLYGFPSPDSDYDLRGVHVLPVEEAVGLLPKRETIEVETVRRGVEIDLVTHDAAKFFSLMLKRNGYVLEQLYSPLVVQSSAAFEELKAIGFKCITRHHVHHYLGFAATQWGLFEKENPPRVKPLLYVYRVLLTGIHLMKTGQIEANLLNLNAEYRLPYVDDLIALKTGSKEQATIDNGALELHTAEYQRLRTALQQSGDESALRQEPEALSSLNDLLIRLRLKQSF